MNIYPAIDLYEKKAVRLQNGDYEKMTVFNDDPLAVALDFEKAGAKFLHTVDLEGAKYGNIPNFEVIKNIAENTSLFIEIGGGIRDMKTAEKYLSAGASRVILGTAAVKNEAFLKEAIKEFGEKTAVGVDLKDGDVAIKGWTEKSGYDGIEFCKKMQDLGVKTVICTDISRDGAMRGTNRGLYRSLSEKFSFDIIASGGISSLDDVRALNEMNISGAIIGKAYYTGKIDIKEALEVCR